MVSGEKFFFIEPLGGEEVNAGESTEVPLIVRSGHSGKYWAVGFCRVGWVVVEFLQMPLRPHGDLVSWTILYILCFVACNAFSAPCLRLGRLLLCWQ